jgi:ADP-heptose:LPS heptosyltransferase
MPIKQKQEHLLILRFSAMGDVAMTVPVVRALAQQYPDIKITVASRAGYKAFFEGIHNVSFFEADFSKHHKGILGLWRLFRQLRNLHITTVADLHNVMRSKVVTKLFALTGIKTATTDKLRTERAQLIEPINKVFKPLPQVTHRHIDALAKLGYSVDINKVNLPEKAVLSKDITAVTGIKTGNWIGIAPFAQHNGKVYPKDLMVEVIHELANAPDTKVFLFGGSNAEAEILRQYANSHQNIVVIAAGIFTLQQELKLISNLDVMVSMDSANAHMAAMLDVKVVTLWGATHPYAGFGPFRQPLSNALLSDREQFPMLPTSIYGNKQVPGYENAMRTIIPLAVVNKVNEVLSR